MDPDSVLTAEQVFRIPHTRGDGPIITSVQNFRLWYSPHAWGWTVGGSAGKGPILVFPTRVGMDRRNGFYVASLGCIPHTRGDGPCGLGAVGIPPAYSPHAWGWTDIISDIIIRREVFPTRVGMDPSSFFPEQP